MFDFVRKPLLWQAWDSGLDKEVADVGALRTRRQLFGGQVASFQLKSMQDLAVYLQLRHATGKQIAEIGAGYSRLLPTLAKTNTCVAVEKFEGKGGGPTTARSIPNVRTVSAYLGENNPLLVSESFDVVFSISVVEHVPTEELAAFHEDQLRILKPGGMFIHAIDLYVEDEPAAYHVQRFDAYRSWVTSSEGVRPVGQIYRGPCRFTCDLATNPDDVMYAWGRAVPQLIELRQAAQLVSLLVAGRKLEPTSRQESAHDVIGSTLP
jgi:SAM-dependent methyltransferase